MAEYIEREAAINAVFEAFADGRSAYIALEAIPAADVVPWEWLERYASGMRMNYASDWVHEARKEYESKI